MTNDFKCRVTPTSLATFCTAASLTWSPLAAGQTRYTASWTSLDTHNPAPEWFQNAKFGIYYHWGAWCVAAYGSEWYPRNMYNKGSGEYNNQTSKYGDPFSDWPYDKFLTGANDKSGKFTQFAPKLKSDGGAWDPDEWAQIFADAGTKCAEDLERIQYWGQMPSGGSTASVDGLPIDSPLPLIHCLRRHLNRYTWASRK